MFKFTLVTPERKILADHPVFEVIVPGGSGELNILAGHAPLVTVLRTGVLKYREARAGDLKSVVVSWGYCEVVGETINILAETVELPGEINLDRADLAKKKALEFLSKTNLDEKVRQKYQNKLDRASVRIDLAAGKQNQDH